MHDINAIALEDLPIRLLQQLDLGRPMLNHADETMRPACAGKEAEYRFDHREQRNGYRGISEELQRSAFALCQGCPLRSECAADADAKREQGLWGGIYRRFAVRAGRKVYESFDLLSSVPVEIRPAQLPPVVPRRGKRKVKAAA